MPTYIALVEVQAPAPVIIKVRAASFDAAEFRIREAFDVQTKDILEIQDLAQVQDIAELLPRKSRKSRESPFPEGERALRFAGRRPVAVRRHVRRK